MGASDKRFWCAETDLLEGAIIKEPLLSYRPSVRQRLTLQFILECLCFFFPPPRRNPTQLATSAGVEGVSVSSFNTSTPSSPHLMATRFRQHSARTPAWLGRGGGDPHSGAHYATGSTHHVRSGENHTDLGTLGFVLPVYPLFQLHLNPSPGSTHSRSPAHRNHAVFYIPDSALTLHWVPLPAPHAALGPAYLAPPTRLWASSSRRRS